MTRSLPGFFTTTNYPSPLLNAVAVDSFTTPDPPTVSASAFQTLGISRVQRLQQTPGVSEKWSVVGFTTQMHVGIATPFDVATPWWLFGKYGDIWVGLVEDPQLQDTLWPGIFFPDPVTATLQPSAPKLPSDLSTLTKIWSPDQGPDLRVILGGGTHVRQIQPELCTLLGATVAFPLPLEAHPGANLCMVIVITPSILSGGDVPFTTPAVAPQLAGTGISPFLFIRDCQFNVLYEEH